MTLPSTGSISFSQINVELRKAANAPISLNDAAVRALAGKPTGAISFADLRGKTFVIVKTITANSANFILKQLFTASEWTSETEKRVIINAGVEVGSASSAWAVATTLTADGQAGSFGGILTLENRGFISGRGGAANGGVGGDAILANFPGKNGQKLIIVNTGTVRAGGGGGSAGGKGGTGGGGYYNTTIREPTSGQHQIAGTYEWQFRDTIPRFWNAKWNGTIVGDGGSSNPPGSLTNGAYTYYLGANYRNEQTGSEQDISMKYYGIYRTRIQVTNTNGGAGGNGGASGRGQGYGQALANGSAGVAGVVGGTNAGRGGTGGTGGAGGGYGASGGRGNTGATGANGNRTSGVAGAASAASGLAGFYCTANKNVNWVTAGTRQGRAG